MPVFSNQGFLCCIHTKSFQALFLTNPSKRHFFLEKTRKDFIINQYFHDVVENSKYIEFDSWASNNFKPDSDQNGQSATDKTMTSFADTISVDSTTSIPLRKSTLQFHLDCFKCSVGRCSNRWISTCADNFYINYKDCTLICTACMKFYKNLTSEAQKRYSRSLDRKPSLFGKRPNPVYVAKKSDRTDTMRVERE